MAIALAEAGAHIVGASFTDNADATKEAVEKAGRRFTYHNVDISDREQLYVFINKVKIDNKKN